MKDKILIIGGYGTVGSIIANHLTKAYPNKVIIAGRNIKKAKKLSSQLNNLAIPYEFDVSNISSLEILKNVRLVIMCIDQKNNDFVETCINHKINYIDITANQKLIEKFEKLNAKAKEKETSVILSVGLAPGITNLLAKHCINKIPDAKNIEILILLGLGEKHGDSAYQWTLENIHKKYAIQINGAEKNVKSFTNPKTTNLLGKRTFYYFNFSDQHSLAKTTNVPTVKTRLAFDSKFFTKLIAILSKTGITKLLNNEKIQKMMIPLFKYSNIGSDVFAVKTVSQNDIKETYQCELTGRNEGNVTALLTVQLAFKVLKTPSLPKGVSHSNEIIENIPLFLESVKEMDKSITLKL